MALAASGATATASSQFGSPGHPSGYYPAGGVNDGEHDGNNWGAGGGWNDATDEVFPDSVEINFGAQRTIQEIHVYTLKNQPNDGSVVNDSTPANVYGIKSFTVEYHSGSGFENVLGGAISGNTLAKRRFVFPPVTTDRIRVIVNDSADHLFSRIVEIEAFTCNPGCPPPIGDNWRVAFETNRDGNSEIYVMDADGRNPVRLTNNGARDGDPFFSPDGSRIVFPSNRDGNYEIYVMNADGTSQTRLTANTADDLRPAFSPDGSKIAFYRGTGNGSEMYVMNADGANQIRLTNNSSADMFPKWSPDGTKLIFHSDRDGDFEIYVMNADGSNVVKLTNNNSYDNEASFSPDGTRIVFASDRSGNTEVWVMNADGGQPVNLSSSSGSDGSSSWAADGSKVLFVSGRDGNSEIYSMNPDGSGQTRLTFNNALENTPVSGVYPAGAARIDAVMPRAGRAGGGQQIKLTGSLAGVAAVSVGGVPAAWSYTNGTSEITLTTPAHAAGAVSIDLSFTSGGLYSQPNAFAYLPTTFTDNTLLPSVTQVKAQHIVELRQSVDSLRAVAGLQPAPWTELVLQPSLTTIKSAHIQELRTYLDEAAARLALPTGGYTDPGLGAGFWIKRIHVEELRQRIRNIAG